MSQMWSDTHLHGINRGVIEIGAGYSGRITGHVLQPGRDIRLFLTDVLRNLHCHCKIQKQYKNKIKILQRQTSCDTIQIQ